jgi:predicted DNA-binding protein YlxM (UPF0122 family)
MKIKSVKEIVDYLVHDYTPSEIADSLNISRASVYRIKKIIDSRFSDISTVQTWSEQELRDKIYVKRNKILSDELIKESLELLKGWNSNYLSVFKQLKKNHPDFSERSYTWFVAQMHQYISDNGLSDLDVFKPCKYMEIGAFNINEKCKVVYAYLPYSRYVKLMVCKTKISDRQLSLFLVSVFRKINALPYRIISSVHVSEITNEQDNPAFHTFMRSCNRLLSTDKKHCVFMKKEESLINELKLLSTKIKVAKDAQPHMEGIESGHNNATKNTNIADIEKIDNKRCVWEGKYTIDYGKKRYKVSEFNSHIRVQNAYYSCPYRYVGQFVKVRQDGDYLYILAPENDAVISTHLLFDNTGMKQKKYYTNFKDLPADDKEWNRSNLLVPKDAYIKSAEAVSEALGEIVKDYLDNKGLRGTLFVRNVLRRLPTDYTSIIDLDDDKSSGQILFELYKKASDPDVKTKNIFRTDFKSENSEKAPTSSETWDDSETIPF